MARCTPQVLPGLIYLRNGSVVDLQDHDAGAIDAPAGNPFRAAPPGAGYISEAAGLDELLVRLRPRVCFFGHHHTRTDAEVAGVALTLGSIKSPCQEIWWPSIWSQANGTSHCSVNTRRDEGY